MSKKPRLLIVRGVQPRMTELLFYSHFKHFTVTMVGDKSTGWIVDAKIPRGIRFIDARLAPRWGFDPISTLLGPLHAHRSWQDVPGLNKLIQESDVVNISDAFYFYSGQAATLCHKYHKKLITIVWETIPRHISSYIPPYSMNVAAVIAQTTLFVARSYAAKKYIKSLGVDENKIRVVYKGIDTKLFTPAYSGKRNVTRILYVGQLVKSKGIIELIDAFKKLSTEFHNVELWMCARSKHEELELFIKEAAKKYPITLLTSVPYGTLPTIYQKCDIYCQLSQEWKYIGIIPGGNEWFSYAILEAMASGLPIVTTGIGGTPEQVGNNNFLVEQKNMGAAYVALKKLILNRQLREEIGKKNTQRARIHFDIIKQAKKTEDAILQTL